MSWFGALMRGVFMPPFPEPVKTRRLAEIRVVVSAIAVLGVFLVIAARIVVLATDEGLVRAAGYNNAHSVERGRLFDRNGRLLAANLPITVLYADPQEIMDTRGAAKALAPMLERHSEADLMRLLSRETRYVELDRKLTPARHAAVLGLGVPGIRFRRGVLRSYPNGSLAAHVLGHVDVDNLGLSGLEKSLEDRLAGGTDVRLSLDLGVQAIVEREIGQQMELFEAIGAAGVLMDIASGEVLAIVSLPDYNPNHYGLASDDARFNRATLGLYEMGSTFKVLNTAIALEAGTTTLERRYKVSTPLRLGGYPIRDYNPFKRPLSVPEILVLSSNIGSARMAAEIGGEVQRAYLGRLGLLERIPVELPERATPLVPRNWRESEIATISYGHGISVSPLHLATAIAAAGGSGIWVEPTLVHRGPGENPIRFRVFSEETTSAIRSMMRLVVAHPNGTGGLADAAGYMVAGKTGTSIKVDPHGGYSTERRIASFAATFPAHAPRYVLVVMIDEPKGQEHSRGYATGGWVAAPAVRRIIENAAPLLGLLPVDERAPEIARGLRGDIKINRREASHAAF